MTIGDALFPLMLLAGLALCIGMLVGAININIDIRSKKGGEEDDGNETTDNSSI